MPTMASSAPSLSSLELTLTRVQDELRSLRMQRLRPETESIANGVQYGSTQALVFGAFETRSGAMVYKIIESDLHFVDTGEEPHMEAIRHSLEQSDYTSASRATCMPAHVALRVYSGYAKLYGERKYASNYGITEPLSKASTTSSLKFMDLPGELRNRIYKLLLVIEPELDLAPKCSGTEDRRFEVHRFAATRYNKFTLILRLLRLNRQFNEEASDIYYGDNEFRFTCATGWFFLLGFLRNIGPANVARLRRLAVPVHADGSDRGPGNMNFSAPSSEASREVIGHLHRLGMWKYSETTPTMNECVGQRFELLEKAGTLQVLRLVLPWIFTLYSAVPPFSLSTASFSKLQIVLVHLRRDVEGGKDQMNTTQRAFDVEEIVDGKSAIDIYKDPHDWACAMGWDYKIVWYDFKGRFPMHNCHNCAVGGGTYDSDWELETCDCAVARTVTSWYTEP